MHVACILAERRGVEIIAPIHDAFLIQADAARAGEASAALDQVMRDASRVVLRGYELGTDEQIIHANDRYYDERGEEMWNTVKKIMAKLEAKTA
jgi:hypothetical protein